MTTNEIAMYAEEERPQGSFVTFPNQGLITTLSSDEVVFVEMAIL